MTPQPRHWQRLVVALALASAAGACASAGGTPRPFPMPETPPAADGGTSAGLPARLPGSITRGPDGGSVELISTALDLRGTRYRFGGADLNGFDCSGFTQYVFAQHAVHLPREVRDQFRVGRPVRQAEIRPGDLLFFTTTVPGPSHVAIALGDDAFVHAPSSRGVVRVEQLSSAYWSRRLVGARRLD